MAGLLGTGWDDPQSNAIMQLAGGLLGGNFAQGASAYGATMAGAKDAAMKRQFLQSQIDENASQNEARKLAAVQDQRKQSMVESMFGGGMGSPGVSPQGAQPTQGGAPQGQPVAQGGAPNLVQFAKQLGIPEQAIQADVVFNGGKRISELLAERSKPNWQNVNGNLVNTNSQGFAGGLQGGMSSSADGKVTAWQPDGKGGLVVGAPEGALGTYRAYQGAGASFKPIKVYNPETGREEYTNEGAVVGGQPAQGGARPGYNSEPAMKSTVAGPMGADPAAIQREIKAVQANLFQPNLDEPSKVLLRAHLADLQSQAKQPGVAQSGNFAAGPSANEAATAEANKTRMVDSSKAGTARIMTGYDSAQSAVEMITSNIEARKSLSGGAFQGTGAETKLAISKALRGMGFDVAPDKVANTDYLQSTLGQGILNKAKTLGTNPTDNDARIIRSIVGSIGTDPQALVKLLDHQDIMANRAIGQHNKNYGDAKGRGFDAGFDLSVKAPAANTNQPAAAPPLPANPTAQTLTKGQAYKLPNGVEAVWDGMKFKAK